jgi:hypothetical protein
MRRKQDRLVRVVNVFLVAVCIAAGCACVVTDSAGKFTASASNSDTARAAKWSFDVEGTTDTANNTVTVALDLDEEDGQIVTTDETTGNYTITVKNLDSEVAATYKIIMTLPSEVSPKDQKRLTFKLTDRDDDKNCSTGDFGTKGKKPSNTLTFTSDKMEFALSDTTPQTQVWVLSVSASEELDTYISGMVGISVEITQQD